MAPHPADLVQISRVITKDEFEAFEAFEVFEAFGGKGICPRAMETMGADGMSCQTPVEHGSVGHLESRGRLALVPACHRRVARGG